MHSEKRLVARQARTTDSNIDRALAEICEQVDARRASVNLLFCSPTYEAKELGRKIERAFSTPIIACMSAGQFGQGGFQCDGITAVSLASNELRLTSHLITPLAECHARASEAAFSALNQLSERGSERAFGFVLSDGLSRAEERLAASLYQSLGAIPLIGGSAGDDMATEATYVYHEGRFHRDAAVLSLFETTLPFATFKAQHARPGRHKLVVTMADPEQRRVHEFNGEPAADAYAQTLGFDVDELGPLFFSKHPLMLRSGGDSYIRSVKTMRPDHSLEFFCAMEEGLVLTVGECGSPSEALQQSLLDVQGKIGVPEIVIGCDCVLRRQEFAHDGLAGKMGELMARNQMVGCSTHGEQFNAIYVNQTLSAVALAAG